MRSIAGRGSDRMVRRFVESSGLLNGTVLEGRIYKFLGRGMYIRGRGRSEYRRRWKYAIETNREVHSSTTNSEMERSDCDLLLAILVQAQKKITEGADYVCGCPRKQGVLSFLAGR